MVRKLCEKLKEKRKLVYIYMAFMDLEKVYDGVDGEALWQVI